MQNQRKNGRPDAAVRMAGLFLVLFCGGGSDSGENTVYGKWFFCRLYSFHGIEEDVCGDCDSGSLDLWGAGAFEARTQPDVLADGGCAGVFLDSCGISADGGVGGVSD